MQRWRALLRRVEELLHLRCGGGELMGGVGVCVVPEQQRTLRLQRKIVRDQETQSIWGGVVTGWCVLVFFLKASPRRFAGLLPVPWHCVHIPVIPTRSYLVRKAF